MARAFRGHDEDVYTWALEPYDGELTWGLRNDRMYSVARYEPCDNLEVSSRDLLYVRDAWMPLTLQIIATLTIMRHIEYYRLP
ncbi:hypothetical protein BS47DRAFT_1336587 [Hydnum rufescens UP504]|uniref:Uncharacterized protein n=1 Tax=Hydnum rufescens UP504 TaxID=1448309 RepID=A0A9P6E291_9AGAM|nr:hypothetical protein BS47DRAFT_1336587 [Hydnum rufescens UP504]